MCTQLRHRENSAADFERGSARSHRSQASAPLPGWITIWWVDRHGSKKGFLSHLTEHAKRDRRAREAFVGVKHTRSAARERCPIVGGA